MKTVEALALALDLGFTVRAGKGSEVVLTHPLLRAGRPRAHRGSRKDAPSQLVRDLETVDRKLSALRQKLVV